MQARALSLLRVMLGPQAEFRAGQWEAIEAVAVRRQRALIVQRTGWGKSIVYFLATKLMREQRSGPTLLVSPLLSLMRNQIMMAGRIGVRAVTIHSGNRAEWDQTDAELAADAVDVLLISPERLNNQRFIESVLPKIGGRIGLFVVDEAHCISDWGHDFRPDYRRIKRIIQSLPKGVPVLATTATANNRVVADVQLQLGGQLLLLRGPLARESLRLQNLQIPDQAHRLAWLAEKLPKLPGSGIIYCLTVADSERVAKWLRSRNIHVKAYHAGDDHQMDRETLEKELLNNEVKALVATVALGMGFDKPDLGFVVHYQRPGSVVAYYQQVGRAGRAMPKAYGIMLNGAEDDDIQNYFIDSAFPSENTNSLILDALATTEGLTINELLGYVNVSWSVAERALKLLEVDGIVGKAREKNRTKYFRTANPWKPDVARMAQVTALRRAELEQMQTYIRHKGCLMEFLGRALDDQLARPCNICSNCQNRGFSDEVDHALIAQALTFLRNDDLILYPRRRWPADLFPDEKASIASEQLNALGRVLSYYGDAGWGKLVREGKYVHGRYADDLVDAATELIQARWHPEPALNWVTAIPSLRHPTLVSDFARKLAAKLDLPFAPVLTCDQPIPEQKTMANCAMQARNVIAAFLTTGNISPGPVLLVDDIIDSGWTMAIAGRLLRIHGSGVVHPFALARAMARTAGT